MRVVQQWLFVVTAVMAAASVQAFGVVTVNPTLRQVARPIIVLPAAASQDNKNSDAAEKEQQVGNLVADDEWEGLGMELSELVRVAVLEDLKKNAREFLGKDEVKVGDISKEIDRRVKSEVANLRNKETYELGDFVMACDEMAKSMTEELTGKPYAIGDLSIELDKRVKSAVADWCGKDSYEFGDLSKELDRRVKNRVAEFISKDDYEFGDITREVDRRRQEWVKDFLGKEAAEDYKFGDISRKVFGNLFGERKGKFGRKD